MGSEAEEIRDLLSRAKSGDPALCARLGMLLFKAGRVEECPHWLEIAATAGDLPALNLYALMHLNGIGIQLDFPAALEMLQRAATGGLKEAIYTLAGMNANGFGTPPDFQHGWQQLVQAARLGHLPAYRSLGILLAANGKSPDAALALLRHAAHGGDVLAQAGLAEYLVQVDQEELASEAGHWARMAAARNVPSAKRSLTGLPASLPAPVPASQVPWEELENLCPPQGKADQALDEVVPKVVFVADDVLPLLIRDYVINVAAPRLSPSKVFDPRTGGSVQNPVRSSYSMYFTPSMCDVVMAFAGNTVADLAGVPLKHSEPLAVLRYGPGQEYKPHMDYLGGPDGNENIEGQGGQRVVTAFVYLNDVPQGGETDFPELKARIKPASGRAVKFYNLDERGMPNPRTLHAGCPVIEGEKWLATYWFRQREFSWAGSTVSPT